jgi:hypothetical protein
MRLSLTSALQKEVTSSSVFVLAFSSFEDGSKLS